MHSLYLGAAEPDAVGRTQHTGQGSKTHQAVKTFAGTALLVFEWKHSR
jgi:hypothetical protein